jgi:signal transduction histidine kinase
MSFLAQKRSRTLANINNPEKFSSSSQAPGNFFYKEIAKLTGSGGWSVDFLAKETFLDDQARTILDLPKDYHASLSSSLDFYTEEYKKKASNFFKSCSNGKSASVTLRMVTYEGDEFWARVIGEPTLNEEGEVVGIRGVFQNIHEEKLREIELVRSLRALESQNNKLTDFSNVITHNLRSHASNLKFTVDLLNDTNDEAEEAELMEALADISESINTTIGHLSELGAIQSKSMESQELVVFQQVLTRVQNKLSLSLQDYGAEIFSDFSEVPHVQYIRSFMESIFINMISNALKYRHPDRNPAIEIYSFKEGDDYYLMFKDNGQGIDLEKHGNRLFNIYQTFHDNKDAVGVGLFMLKKKIESLHGSISVQSQVGKGTRFLIRF